MQVMVYKVKEIQEDLDFGCEERSEDSPVMAIVLLTGEDGREKMTRQEDQLLYARNSPLPLILSYKNKKLIVIYGNSRRNKK